MADSGEDCRAYNSGVLPTLENLKAREAYMVSEMAKVRAAIAFLKANPGAAALLELR